MAKDPTKELSKREQRLAAKRREVSQITEAIDAAAIDPETISKRIDSVMFRQVERIASDISMFDEIANTRNPDDLVRINDSQEVMTASQAASRRNLLIDDLIKIKKSVVDRGNNAVNTQVNVGINMNDVISKALDNIKNQEIVQ